MFNMNLLLFEQSADMSVWKIPYVSREVHSPTQQNSVQTALFTENHSQESLECWSK